MRTGAETLATSFPSTVPCACCLYSLVRSILFPVMFGLCRHPAMHALVFALLSVVYVLCANTYPSYVPRAVFCATYCKILLFKIIIQREKLRLLCGCSRLWASCPHIYSRPISLAPDVLAESYFMWDEFIVAVATSTRITHFMHYLVEAMAFLKICCTR